MNPADGPSSQPDYKAQEEPSLVQKDLLVSKLAESNPDLLETARLNSGTCPSRQSICSGTCPLRQSICSGTCPLRQSICCGTSPSRQPIYMAQRELSPVMDSLCNTANCQLCIAARPELEEFNEARSELLVYKM